MSTRWIQLNSPPETHRSVWLPYHRLETRISADRVAHLDVTMTRGAWLRVTNLLESDSLVCKDEAGTVIAVEQRPGRDGAVYLALAPGKYGVTVNERAEVVARLEPGKTTNLDIVSGR